MKPALLLLLALLATSTLADPLQLHVSPTGNDAADGSAAHPFASLARARDEIRKRQPPGGATVTLAAGTYRLTAPLELEPQDSGADGAPITYQAAPGAAVALSGGVAITGWRVTDNGRWQADLPDVKAGQWNFSQLFANDQRRFRPRLPKTGYYYIARELPPTDKAKGYDRFAFNPGEIRADFAHLDDVETLCFSHWFMSRLKIASVDDARHAVTFTGSTRTTADYGRLQQGWRYLLENVPDALSDPGEWYLDRKAGALTYIPRPGETPENTTIVAPRLDHVLILRGDVAKRQWVRNVIFKGITFEHTNWNVPKDGYSSPQAEVAMPGAVTATAARDCAFVGCTVRHTAGYGIELATGCKRDTITECTLYDLGAGGIKVGTPNIPADAEAISSNNKVTANLLTGGGRFHPAGIGVLVLQSPDNLVEHNDIADFYYTGISSGWTWGYVKALAIGNQYTYNYVHQIGQGVLSDMGGIYTLGDHTGSAIRFNRFEDISSFTYGGWGIYFDEGTTNLVAENNLVLNTKTGGFHQHYGKENQVRNNVFVNGAEQWAERTRVEEHTSFTFERNVLIGTSPTVFKGNWKDKVIVDFNDYWRTDGQPPTFGGLTLADWQAKSGQDAHSVVGNPRLTDVNAGDCQPMLGSHAEAFKGFSVADAGLPAPLRDRDRPRPTVLPAYPTHPAPSPKPGPQAIHEDFEDTPAGRMATNAVTSEDKTVRAAKVRVAEGVAASGKRALKFEDAPGQKASYTPMLHWRPAFTEGTLRGSFDVRLEGGAVLSHEWRTDGQPYKVGPSLYLKDGHLLLRGGKKLADYPTSQWFHVDIRAGVGKDATGTWELRLKFEGNDEQTFKDLPCDKDFPALMWYGFASNATEATVMYLDNVDLAPAR